jgi:proteasome accessory factor B
MAAMKKLERLLDLVALLLETERPLTRHEIRGALPPGAYAEDDESFRRTFERDKDELRELGLPIVLEAVAGWEPSGSGYRIHRSAMEADLPALDPEELASLALASAMVGFDEAAPDVPIWMLGGTGVAADLDRARPVAEVPGDSIVRDLMRAVTGGLVVSFVYKGERRVVEPHRLVFTRGHWQLSGRDRKRLAGRQYRCDRFESGVDVGDERIEPPEVPIEVREDHAWQFGDAEAEPFRILVDERHVTWLTGFLPSAEVVERRDDGSIVVQELVREPDAFRSFLLTFLDGAEVLEPAWFRAEMVAWLEALA